MKERQQGRERWGLMFREDTRVKGCGDRQWNIREKEVVRERESKRVMHGPREIYNTGNKPNWPPNKRSMEHIRFYVVPIQGNENNYRVHA